MGSRETPPLSLWGRCCFRAGSQQVTPRRWPSQCHPVPRASGFGLLVSLPPDSPELRRAVTRKDRVCTRSPGHPRVLLPGERFLLPHVAVGPLGHPAPSRLLLHPQGSASHPHPKAPFPGHFPLTGVPWSAPSPCLVSPISFCGWDVTFLPAFPPTSVSLKTRSLMTRASGLQTQPRAPRTF